MEDALELNGVIFHVLHFSNIQNLAGAVAQTRYMDNHIQRTGYLCAYQHYRESCGLRQVHRLEAGKTIAQVIRVQSHEETAVPVVHGL